MANFHSVANFLIGLIIIIISSVIALNFSRYQFGGYDLSPIIDLSWRIKNGEIPGQDYINTMPPIVIIILKLTSIKELSWHDLTFLHFLSTAFTYLFLSSFNSAYQNSNYLIILSLILSLPLVYTNHIWHSSLSQYLGIMYVYSTYNCLQERTDLKCLALLTISSALIITGKQNVAVPYFLASLLYLAVSNNNDKYKIITCMLIGIIIGFISVIFILKIPLDNLLYIYSAVAGRGLPHPQLLKIVFSGTTNIISIVIVILFIFLSAISVYRNKKIRTKDANYLILCGLISFLPILTDWDSKINNASLPIFIFFLFTQPSLYVFDNGGKLLKHQYNRNEFINCASFLLVIYMFLVALYGGYLRERMKNVGPFYQIPADILITGGYFDGLITGKQFSEILFEIGRVKEKFINKKIFFGPRIEFGYAVTNIRSPSGLPLWWHPGTSYAIIDLDKIFENFISNEFDVLCFARSDRTRMPIEIINYIKSKYVKLDGYKEIDVYITKEY